MPRGIATDDSLSVAELVRILEKKRAKIGKVEKKRDALLKKVDALNAQITKMGGSAKRGRGRPPGSANVSASGRAKNAMSLVAAMEAVLNEAGGPLSVGDIVEKVKAAGYRSSSDNFRGIVNQTLIKEKGFTAPSRGMYQLKK